MFQNPQELVSHYLSWYTAWHCAGSHCVVAPTRGSHPPWLYRVRMHIVTCCEKMLILTTQGVCAQYDSDFHLKTDRGDEMGVRVCLGYLRCWDTKMAAKRKTPWSGDSLKLEVVREDPESSRLRDLCGEGEADSVPGEGECPLR